MNLPTDFDDELIDDTETIHPDTDQPDTESEQEKPAQTNGKTDNASGKDDDGVPYCVKHHCRMKHASSGRKGSKVAYYKCPVKDCDEKAKRIKTNRESSIPTEPRCCSRCVDNKGKPIVMERDQRLSKPFFSILRCPACLAKTEPLPRPEFVASHRAALRRQRVPNIGDR